MSTARKFPPPKAEVDKWADHFGLPPAPRSHPELPPRDFAAAVEVIATLCGRMVERRADPERARSHTYRLWEPVEDGRRYGVTRKGRDGRQWGLASTRRPATPLDEVALIYHELAEQRRAMGVMRERVLELGRRTASGEPGGIAECIYSSRGDLLLFSDPEASARIVAAQRRPR